MASTQNISVSPFPPARRSRLPRYHLGPASRSISLSRLEATRRPHRGHLGGFTMQMLIVGIGALGGTIAARALRAGLPVRLAARNTESAEVLRRSGLRVPKDQFSFGTSTKLMRTSSLRIFTLS